MRPVVFDLGGVLIDWDPRHLYRKLFDDADEMEAFLREVCSPDWIRMSDAGRPLKECVAELAGRHPAQAALIEVFEERWEEMQAGPIQGSVDILRGLKDRGVPLFVLSNFSVDTWPYAKARFDFLDWFEALVVSGFEGVAKPETEIYRRLEGHGVALEEAVFIDDRADNIAAAEALGMTGILFTSAGDLRRQLSALALL